MVACFRDIKAPGLAGIREEVATLQIEVHSFAEIQVTFIPLIIPSFTQSMPPYCPRLFDLFIEEETIPVVGIKRGRDEELQDPTIPYD